MIYNYDVTLANKEKYSLKKYENNVMLIVNTASECGFTKQFDGLEQLYKKYKDYGFVVLGFPCNQFGNQEPGDGAEALQNCRLNYGVTFPMHEKIDVNGDHAHPLFVHLKEQTKGVLTNAIKWNFTKFLIDQNGKVIKRYGSTTTPEKIEKDIETLLNNKRD
ncbi:glutathione peroxidase [Macrococcus sp. DPC7161]|uniref:glutathione peroxidase n=1 Tax=Macrococcus sp. DPC7161 TaxID=2507060 RepID=UPI00100BA18D|nr:glutathione peroxidase [Macrococcus sp. DPC7161]RXK19045.1 glutathione peroxidase [Macrococcus sp. DPC7161]